MPCALTLAAGATTAGAAASAGARHKGRLCSRSPGCLPRAILLAPGRLPVPAVHTRAFHEGSGDDLLPGGRGRREDGAPACRRPAPRARLLLRGPARVSEGLARGSTSPLLGMGQSGFPCPICTMPVPLLPHLQDPEDTLTHSLGTLLHLSSHSLCLNIQKSHVPLGAPVDGSSSQSWEEQRWQKRVLGQRCNHSTGCWGWHNPPLLSW